MYVPPGIDIHSTGSGGPASSPPSLPASASVSPSVSTSVSVSPSVEDEVSEPSAEASIRFAESSEHWQEEIQIKRAIAKTDVMRISSTSYSYSGTQNSESVV